MRATPALVVLLAVGTLAGCYATTDPPSNVGPRQATLRAHGTTNSGPAQSWFEYWPVGAQAGNVGRTRTYDWPGGIENAPKQVFLSGYFPEPPYFEGLYPSTEYAYRICGHDVGKSTVCAQTVTFTTWGPTNDRVDLETGSANGHSVSMNAQVRGAEGPGGLLHIRAGFEQWFGDVTCMSLSGTTATIGAVGHRSRFDNPNPNVGTLGRATVTVKDARYGPGADTLAYTYSDGSAPPSCATPLSGNAGLPEQRITVIDAP
jgi:hypothetical protein